MKRNSTIFLQMAIALIGIGAVALLLCEPQIEGVNAHATNFEIYFKDPFLMLVYIGAIPFFIALTQAFKLLRRIRQNMIFSKEAVKTLRTIKFCAIVIIGFVLAEEVFIMLNHESDDPAGGVFMGVLIIFISIIVATATAIFERILQSAVDIKMKNDLSVS